MDYQAKVELSRLPNGMMEILLTVDESNLGLIEALKTCEVFREPNAPVQPPHKAKVLVYSVTIIE